MQYLQFFTPFFYLSGTTSTFTFVNRCNYTVWPGMLAYSGNPPRLPTTGFELPTHSSRSFQVPTGWSGRIWARTGCKLDRTGSLSCQTGDCGSGQVECNGSGPSNPVTLVEVTLGSINEDDFYDVTLVDGFNVPLNLEAVGGSGSCGSAGCTVDLNRLCPVELAVGDGNGCRSPCEALGKSEYCCIGAYGLREMCRPNVYSEMFKAACPRSYSYAYDDVGNTFVCNGADYVVTFCPYSTFSSS